eukprot:TRINITY_DN1822_c0_g2_i1.p1 TRINITY_DN1822_c0_g2~~TRINITY_DN1822_c0_g2_i1.p1  ORF type:complete len:929 (-),score=281.68 TRINITY_DN1822_c0_g2_i1:389-3175(-)
MSVRLPSPARLKPKPSAQNVVAQPPPRPPEYSKTSANASTPPALPAQPTQQRPPPRPPNPNMNTVNSNPTNTNTNSNTSATNNSNSNSSTNGAQPTNPTTQPGPPPRPANGMSGPIRPSLPNHPRPNLPATPANFNPSTAPPRPNAPPSSTTSPSVGSSSLPSAPRRLLPPSSTKPLPPAPGTVSSPNSATDLSSKLSSSAPVSVVSPQTRGRANAQLQAEQHEEGGNPSSPSFGAVSGPASVVASEGEGTESNAAIASVVGPTSGTGAAGTPGAPAKKVSDKRTMIAREILETETAYVNHIGKMIETYMTRLLEASKTPGTGLEEAEVKKLFSNINIIYKFNSELLKDIKERIDHWDSKTQKLGDLFTKMAPYLKLYTDYGNNYKYAIEKHNYYNNNNQTFVTICAECKQECKLNLESLLIMPIQRVPRYNLLLDDLIKHTEETHPDYNDLKMALSKMKEVAVHINNTVATTEKLKIVAAAGKLLTNVVQVGRSLKRNGQLQAITDGGRKDRFQFYLFNDVLVFASKNEVKKQSDIVQNGNMWPINLVWLNNITALSFEIVGPNKQFVITGNPAEEQGLWLTDIQKSLEGKQIIRKEGFVFGPEAKYDGEWKMGKIHGKGVYELFGNVYDGNWDNGMKSGSGTMYYNTGDVYYGEWMNDRQQGNGKLEYYDGSFYEGDWKNGSRHGNGKFVFGNKIDYYDGGWDVDRPSNFGTLVLRSRRIEYTGAFNEGRFHGKGTLKSDSTGKIYMGEWVKGYKEGHGVMDYGNGERYEGGWKGGKKNGQGTWVGRDKSEVRYVGGWKDGKKEGSGRCEYADGSLYDGMWKEGKRQGNGRMEYSNGEVYVGQWKGGKENGAGVYQYGKNGAVEVTGKWSKGMLEGKVVMGKSGGGEADKVTGNCKDGLVSVSMMGGTLVAEIEVVPRPPRFDFGV